MSRLCAARCSKREALRVWLQVHVINFTQYLERSESFLLLASRAGSVTFVQPTSKDRSIMWLTAHDLSVLSMKLCLCVFPGRGKPLSDLIWTRMVQLQVTLVEVKVTAKLAKTKKSCQSYGISRACSGCMVSVVPFAFTPWYSCHARERKVVNFETASLDANVKVDGKFKC